MWHIANITGQPATEGGQLLLFAHRDKYHCIENYWRYGGCYSCVSINRHTASKRLSRINSIGSGFCETEITPWCALKVPLVSTCCHQPGSLSFPKRQKACMTSKAMGSHQHLPLPGPLLGVPATPGACSMLPKEVYIWCKWTKTYKSVISAKRKQSRNIWPKVRCVFGLNVPQQFGLTSPWCLRKQGERRMRQVLNARVLLQCVHWTRARG